MRLHQAAYTRYEYQQYQQQQRSKDSSTCTDIEQKLTRTRKQPLMGDPIVLLMRYDFSKHEKAHGELKKPAHPKPFLRSCNWPASLQIRSREMLPSH